MTTLCQSCGFDNPPGMRFCGNCGTRLASSATPQKSSAAPNQLGVMMGADLMTRFREAGLQAAGQRRNVTVLFADLCNYTRLSEQIDSEDLYDIVQQYINMLVGAVYKYDGMVDKIVGDGLMALFGAPIAHENNAERAIHAAIDMQAGIVTYGQEVKEQYGVDLQMHIGLHAGTVIVGGVGSDVLMDYTAIGDTVNLAQRFEESASPGQIMVSEQVYRQTKMLFDFEERPGLALKGYSEPKTGYLYLGVKEKPGSVRGLEGLRAPMIGREAELQMLLNAAARHAERGQGSFALIRGEAGIGKSRLIAEMKSKLLSYPLSVIQGQSLTYRRSMAYWIFLDLLRNYLGLAMDAPDAEVQSKLEQRTRYLLGARTDETLPFLEHLFSLTASNPAAVERIRALDANQLRQQIFIAIRDLLVAEAQKQPLVLVLDDLHWADDASLDLILFLLDSVQQLPIFICGITRPFDEGILLQIAEKAKKRLGEHYIDIRLKNLPPDQSEQLLYQLLTIPQLPESLKQEIVQRASGVPFYLEEILRMLIDDQIIYFEDGHWLLNPEADISSLGVPDNLQALILTRFDHLDQQYRQILQFASVIGREFSLPVLAALLDDTGEQQLRYSLSYLIERAFIQPRPESPRVDFAFRHVLTSDAIYSTLLRRERKKLHGRVGDTIEKVYPERLNENTYLLARHYSWSPNLSKALHYLILAGQKAARDFINVQAQEYFEQALEILPKTEYEATQAFAIHMGLADVLVFIGEYENAREHYSLAQDYLDPESPDQIKDFVTLQRKIGVTFERQGDYDRALEYLAQAQIAMMGRVPLFPVAQAEVFNDIGWIHFRRGNFGYAGKIFQQALECVVDSDSYGVVASIYNRLGGVAYYSGDWDQAATYLRNSISIRESIGDVAGLASSSNNLGNLEIEMGQFDEALEDLKRNFALVERLGQVEGIAVAYNNLGWLYTLRGETKEAELSLNTALKMAQQIGFISLEREARKNIGELYLTLEEWDQAQSVLAEVAPSFEELGADDQLLQVYRLLGEAAIGGGDLKTAREWMQKLTDITNRFGKNGGELPALQRGEMLRYQGMLAIETKEFEQAEQYLQQSLAAFRKLRSRLHIGRTLYQLGRLAVLQNHKQIARGYFDEAASVFVQIGASLDARMAERAQRETR